MDYADVSTRLSQALDLASPPVALALVVTSPAGVRTFAGEVPSACTLWRRAETGYQSIQGTKPQTLAYALTDSPAGLAAWIVEKFHAWTDHGQDLDACVGRDAMLTNLMLYWVTGAIGSTFWPYYARLHEPWIVPPGQQVLVPTGYAEHPREILTPPRSLAELMYGNIQRWTRMPAGGHFPAVEEPEMLAEEIRAFFRPLRGRPASAPR